VSVDRRQLTRGIRENKERNGTLDAAEVSLQDIFLSREAAMQLQT